MEFFLGGKIIKLNGGMFPLCLFDYWMVFLDMSYYKLDDIFKY